ncbi:MAG: glycosyltransferase [Phycisphaerales bacterium]|nr:glycosyltransferase [Phycisphaerales bacterium]
MSGRSLTIVVPLYREAARAERLVRALDEFAMARAPQLAVSAALVDDGSDDGTADRLAAAIRATRDSSRFRLIQHESNRGKGAAVATGVLAATTDLVLMSDADLSAPLSQFDPLLAAVDAGADIAIGSRDLPGSRLEPPQPLRRRLLAWSFRALRRHVLLPDIRDTQCGFKLFRGDVARSLFSELATTGWLFDCEILVRAGLAGLRVVETPIVWRNDPDSRVRPLRDALPTLNALRRIARLQSGERRRTE